MRPSGPTRPRLPFTIMTLGSNCKEDRSRQPSGSNTKGSGTPCTKSSSRIQAAATNKSFILLILLLCRCLHAGRAPTAWNLQMPLSRPWSFPISQKGSHTAPHRSNKDWERFWAAACENSRPAAGTSPSMSEPGSLFTSWCCCRLWLPVRVPAAMPAWCAGCGRGAARPVLCTGDSRCFRIMTLRMHDPGDFRQPVMACPWAGGPSSSASAWPTAPAELSSFRSESAAPSAHKQVHGLSERLLVCWACCRGAELQADALVVIAHNQERKGWNVFPGVDDAGQ